MRFLNDFNLDIPGLQAPVTVESLNKRFWFLCQHWLAARQGPQQRFRDLITSIPDIRLVASKLKEVPSEKLCFLFKVWKSKNLQFRDFIFYNFLGQIWRFILLCFGHKVCSSLTPSKLNLVNLNRHARSACLAQMYQ